MRRAGPISTFWSSLLVAASCLLPATAQAHPHSWIDLAVTVIFDGAGNAIGLRETWLFDDYYTAYVFEKDKPTQAKLDTLAQTNLAALEKHDYFTRVEAAGGRVGLGGISERKSAMREGRIEMSFVLAFAQPVKVGKDGLRYAIFDPTYYIEMLHQEGKGAVRLEKAPSSCRHRLQKPNPTTESIAKAYRLDKTESAGDGLGMHFAEWVAVSC
jgi:ABC-type uncharacterized transport system substrate-binding protein